MDPAQNLISQYAQEAQEERTKPAEVLEDAVNEGKEYEKSLLQGVGGLVAGSSVEKGFKQLANSKKGAETLKKLGMSDEDVEQVISAIKGKDASSLTEFLARKGTGYVKNLSKELGGKAKEVFQKLKKGEMPTRQDLEDAINRGGGESVKPTTSNRSSSKALAEDDEDDGLSVFDKLISKGKNAIRGTTKSLEDKLGDIPAKLSKQAQSIGNDARDVARGAESSVKSISQPNSVFDRARAEFQGDDDLEGQVSAVKKLLGGSKAGRRAIRQNAKDKAEGKKPIRQKKQQTEFDEEDEQGDLLSEATKKIRVKGKAKAKPVEDEQPIGELNPFTNEPIATPQQKVDALKSKADDELKQAQDQLANEGDREPYQDVYDKAKMDSERFTPKQSTGEPMKQDLDLKFKAPTEEEAKAQFKAQEQAKPETNKTSFDEVDKTPFKQDVLDDLPDLPDVIQNEAPTISVPPSQQTGGLDPSTLPDDAGFQRGSAKIQAKTEVDPPKPPPEAPKPTEPTDTEAVQQQVKEVQQTARTQVDTKPVIEEQPQAPKPPPEAPKPPPKPIRPDDIPNDPLKELDPLDPANRIPKDIPPIGDDALEEGTSAVKKGLTKAFEDSLDADEDPFGVIVSGVLGIGALIAGAFGKAHHPHFIQPPTSAPYENFSVQEGVA